MVECYVQYGRILYEFVLYRKPEFYETRQIEFRSIRTTTGANVIPGANPNTIRKSAVASY
jgi:hypothetical protein